MAQLIGLLLLSFFISSILLIPFIDFLYKIKFRRLKQTTKDIFDKPTPIFDTLHAWKAGTPVGGGILIIAVVTILSFWSYGLLDLRIKPWELFALLFTFISFGILGFYDDLKKFFIHKDIFFGLRFRHKFVIQVILAFFISLIFYYKLGYDFVYIHWLGQVNISILFIPLATFIIVSFANAFNITDGLDGLACGVLTICLGAFWVISATLLDPTLGIFIAIWIGSLIAFLYFNVFPARIMLGDVGSMSFGATLAVVGLLTGKITAIVVIGGIFIIEVGSSLIQILSKKYFGKKILPVAPFHLLLQKAGWEEPKVVTRAWLAAMMLAFFGIWLAVI